MITSFDVYELYPSTSSISSVILIASNANIAAVTAQPAGPVALVAPYVASFEESLAASFGAAFRSRLAIPLAAVRLNAGDFFISVSTSAPAIAPTTISVPIVFASLILRAVALGSLPGLSAQHPDSGSITKFSPQPM